MPTSTAASTWSGVIAGPFVMSAVPAAILCACRPGACPTSPATPMSTTMTSAPTCRPKALMTAPPARKLPTICAVTSCGHGDTPCAWTPWSPAKTAMVTGSGIGGGHTPYMPDRRVPRSSRAPSEPGGLVSMDWRSSAAVIASREAGVIAATVSVNRDIGDTGSPRKGGGRPRFHHGPPAGDRVSGLGWARAMCSVTG